MVKYGGGKSRTKILNGKIPQTHLKEEGVGNKNQGKR